MIFEPNKKIVFAGDSVTDDGRARPIGIGNGLGNGYVSLIDTFLSVDFADLNLACINMGSSGNTSADLLARWDSDVNALNPDYVAILIGINDVWRQFDRPQYPEQAVSLEDYRKNLNEMLDKTTAQPILMSPFYMELNKSDAMRMRVDEYSAVCKEIAVKRSIEFIDLQAEFDKVLQYRYPAFISWDRVHPGKVGSLIIARAFMKIVEK